MGGGETNIRSTKGANELLLDANSIRGVVHEYHLIVTIVFFYSY